MIPGQGPEPVVAAAVCASATVTRGGSRSRPPSPRGGSRSRAGAGCPQPERGLPIVETRRAKTDSGVSQSLADDRRANWRDSDAVIRQGRPGFLAFDLRIKIWIGTRNWQVHAYAYGLVSHSPCQVGEGNKKPIPYNETYSDDVNSVTYSYSESRTFQVFKFSTFKLTALSRAGT